MTGEGIGNFEESPMAKHALFWRLSVYQFTSFANQGQSTAGDSQRCLALALVKLAALAPRRCDFMLYSKQLATSNSL
jgi:hypothetical protein